MSQHNKNALKKNTADKAGTSSRQELIEKEDKFKLELIAAVSHEIRTPLAITKQLIALIFDETAGPINNKQREILVKAQGNLARLKNIMDEMLDLSKIEKDKFNLKFSFIHINELLKDIEQDYQDLIKEKRLTLELKLLKKEESVFIDPERTRQAITNLINNAIKFSKVGGCIRLATELKSYFIHIGVFDEGIGIAEEDCRKIFDPFVKLPQQDVYMNQGLGLGLSIVQEIVRKQGGESWVESTLGKGSRFYISVPRYHTLKAFSNEVKKSFNHLLNLSKYAGIINIVFINYEDIEHKANQSIKKIFKDIEEISLSAIREFLNSAGEEKLSVVSNPENGILNFLVKDISSKNADLLVKIISEKLKSYCLKNNLTNVYMAAGLIKLNVKNKSDRLSFDVLTPPDAEYCISSDMRRSRRIEYQSRLEIIWPHSAVQHGDTLDIFYYGVCFVGNRLLHKDQRVQIKILLKKIKKTIEVSARVAWVTALDADSKKSPKYKIGMEFIKFKKGDYDKLVNELKLYL